ncbi:hypothetical protein GOP47_0019762 [Adiantum capillus-veneris]|uniref:DUF641 domain-containing protein n=1 Tax=Adiantum capillus-veneris TaxID=13818 RepID=A0A9D4UCD9_ADICA|nr:hypothetical protein GOP47_0019762 [Adiantum capillus-veneris]
MSRGDWIKAAKWLCVGGAAQCAQLTRTHTNVSEALKQVGYGGPFAALLKAALPYLPAAHFTALLSLPDSSCMITLGLLTRLERELTDLLNRAPIALFISRRCWVLTREEKEHYYIEHRSSSKPNMPNSPAESPQKTANITDFVQRIYKRKPSKLFKKFEQGQGGSDDSIPTDGDASSSGGGCSGTPSRSRSTEFNADGHLANFIHSSNMGGSKTFVVTPCAFLDSPSPPATLPDPSLLAVKLQSAHSPYDHAKHEFADKAVVSDIRRLSELKHSYLERDAIVSGQPVDYGNREPSPSPQPTSNLQPTNAYEGIVSSFHSEIQKKNAEVESLKDMLAESTLQKEKLERNVNRLEQWIVKEVVPVNGETSSIFEDEGPTPLLLESAVQNACEVSKSFTKLLLSLMKAAQWDLDAASDSIELGVSYAKRSHQNLSSILDPEKHRRECFDEYLDMKELDPLELISVNPDCVFGKFCHKKFLQLVHPKMETSFFGNFEHRNQITDGSHPNSQFYQSFLRVAKSVWLVHRLAFSFNPNVSIFLARRGTVFSPLCMESVVPGMEINENNELAKVGLTVMPGFRVDKLVIKCQVYLEALEGSTE